MIVARPLICGGAGARTGEAIAARFPQTPFWRQSTGAKTRPLALGGSRCHSASRMREMPLPDAKKLNPV